MVWFQCEDCGENLKKPKLAHHFRICSAYKLSCIDCGQMFDQQSVQNHTQCMTEMEKYGPKGQGNVSQSGQTKSDKPKKNLDVDANVGLSSRFPWTCSLCKTETTSQQTLLAHADGKKHRAKARAFHAAQNQSNPVEEPTSNGKESGAAAEKVESAEKNGSSNKVQESDIKKETGVRATEDGKSSLKRKTREEESEDGSTQKIKEKKTCDVTNGGIIQVEQSEASERKSKKTKGADDSMNHEDQPDKQAIASGASHGKIKWKKLVTSTLKLSGGVMKIKKLQKLIISGLKESGVTENDEKLRDKLMQKISSSTRFSIDKKRIRLVAKD